MDEFDDDPMDPFPFRTPNPDVHDGMPHEPIDDIPASYLPFLDEELLALVPEEDDQEPLALVSSTPGPVRRR